MLCSTCGSKIQIKKGVLICRTCVSEFDFFDFENELIPEPVFVTVRLSGQHAIFDTRKQTVYAFLDAEKKALLIANLLNRNLAKLNLISRMRNS